jgi:hypothetical protein
MARQQADILLSDPSVESKTIFVEPPKNGRMIDIRVIVYVDPTKWARHRLEAMSSIGDSTLQVFSDKYNQDVSEALCEALYRVSNLYCSLALRIHLGHYLMERYKAGVHTLEEYGIMVTDRRATGRLDTR